MSEHSQGAGKPRKVAAKRLGAKSASGKTVRLQLHLAEETVKRLGVHCSLAGRNQSAMVEEVLSSYLRHRGQGRELWGTADPEDSPEGADLSA